MSVILVTFYDGKSSVGHSATVLLTDHVWEIAYLDQDNQAHVVNWNLEGIDKKSIVSQVHIFKYGTFPQQTIESADNTLLDHFNAKVASPNLAQTSLEHVVKGGIRTMLGVCLMLFGLMLTFYFWVLPFVADKVASYIPQQYEEMLGKSISQSILLPYDKNEALTKSVNDFAKAMQFNTNYNIQVTVVRENELNGFAIPGGHIVIFDELVEKMQTKEELAALLAHEVAHIHYRHSLRNLCRSTALGLFLSFMFNDINGITSVLVDNSQTLLNLNYSRELEIEADHKGLEILDQNHLNQYGFVQLFERLSKEHEETEKILAILSSHPLTTERIAYSKQHAMDQRGVVPNQVLENKWKKIKYIQN